MVHAGNRRYRFSSVTRDEIYACFDKGWSSITLHEASVTAGKREISFTETERNILKQIILLNAIKVTTHSGPSVDAFPIYLSKNTTTREVYWAALEKTKRKYADAALALTAATLGLSAEEAAGWFSGYQAYMDYR